MMNRKFSLKGWAAVCVASILFSCSGKETPMKELKGEVFGTYYSIKYKAEGGEKVSQAGLDSVLAEVDNSLSTFNPSSVISRINQNDTTVRVDSLFSIVFGKGQYVSEQSHGAFDMTVAPLVNCWGFGFRKSEEVTPQLLDSLMRFVGYTKVRLDGGRVVKEYSQVMIDASAIAKGFSCDHVAQYLRNCGVKDFMVEIGGEVVVSGSNAKGEPWAIGITQPDENNSIDQPAMQAVIRITDCGMATSGNYRQFYYKDGKRFSHTINPKTGYPVEHNLLSASVVMPDCMTADAFATAFMVMGIDSAFALASRHPEMAAYFIYADEQNQLQVKYTKSFEQFLK